jgi:hypothetical protein
MKRRSFIAGPGNERRISNGRTHRHEILARSLPLSAGCPLLGIVFRGSGDELPVRRELEHRFLDAVRGVRSELRFQRQYLSGDCQSSELAQVPRNRRTQWGGAGVGAGWRQVRVRVGPALRQYRQRPVGRLLRQRALFRRVGRAAELTAPQGHWKTSARHFGSREAAGCEPYHTRCPRLRVSLHR